MLEKLTQIFKKKEPEAPPVGEIGIEKSMLYAGTDFWRYNPDDLMIRKGSRVYENMIRDDQVKPVTQFKMNAVLSRNWYFDVEINDEGEPDSKQQEMADFFEFAIQHIKGSFSDKLICILSAFQNGFSIVEKVFEPIEYDGKTYWGVKDLKLKPFDSFNGGFKTDEYGNILELNQFAWGEEIKIPLAKIIHFVHQPDVDRLYGESDLRAAYRSWWSKDMIIKFQNIHLERHASGFVWAQVEGNLLPQQKLDLENLLKNISAQMGAHVPKSVTLNMMQPVNTDSFEKAIAQHDKAIAKSILVPNLLGLSEQGEHGSYSQSETQLTAFFWILDIIAARLEETLNEQLFRQLAIWNFATERYPWFRFEPISDDQKAEIAKGWAELVSKGAVTKSDTDEAHIRQLVGFPEKAEEEEPEEGLLPGEIPGQTPEDEPPDNEEWISGQPEEKREQIKKEFAEKPWLKRVDFARLERTLDDHDEGFRKELNDALARIKVALENRISKMVGERSLGNVQPKEIDTIEVPKNVISAIKKIIRENLKSILERGYTLAREELPKKVAAKVIRPGMDRDQAERFLASKAMRIAGIIEQDILNGAQRVLENSIKYDKTLTETLKMLGNDYELAQLLPEVDAAGRAINIPARLENIVRTNIADAINQARTALFNEPEFKGFVIAFEYSAVLDDRVSDICEHLNGKILKDFGYYTPPNHFQCRSLLVPITIIDEWNGKESPKPRMEPQKGFA